jgi:branched-subunit amino acid transport protein AzlD
MLAIRLEYGEMVYVHMMGKSLPTGLMSMLLIQGRRRAKLMKCSSGTVRQADQ